MTSVELLDTREGSTYVQCNKITLTKVGNDKGYGYHVFTFVSNTLVYTAAMTRRY